jgi:4-hydroxy-tetrahydrodipicolinate synthase
MNHDLSGLNVALATPFTAAGAVDDTAFRKLVRHVVDGGADGLVVLGSTGEAATVDDGERARLIETCLEASAGRRVIVGTGSSSTRQCAQWTRAAQRAGAHGALVVTPPYNKPTPAGLVAHYLTVADAAPGLPLVAYNVPSRTGTNLTPAVLSLLWANDAVVAVKESSGNLAQIAEIGRSLPRGKQLLAGDDGLALASIAVGAVGLVSVAGNLVPREAKGLVEASRGGRLDEARRLQSRLLPLIDALFAESNPMPLKAGLELLGLGEAHVRLPLVPASGEARARLETALRFVRENRPALPPAMEVAT